MGKGQRVSAWYIGIRAGEPHPIMAMKVGMGRERRESGVVVLVRVRMYS